MIPSLMSSHNLIKQFTQQKYFTRWARGPKSFFTVVNSCNCFKKKKYHREDSAAKISFNIILNLAVSIIGIFLLIDLFVFSSCLIDIFLSLIEKCLIVMNT